MGPLARFQPVFSVHWHWLAVPAESAVAQPRSVGLGNPSAPASTAPCVDAGLSDGIVGNALSALPPSRIFAGTLVPRNDVVSLLIIYSPQRIRSVSALVRARARKCSFDRRDECSNHRIDPGGIGST